MKNLVVTINGRDAVPVRALCFADDLKRLSPDLVAQAAAGEDHYEGTWRLPTYYMSEGSTIELKASQWAYCCRRLKSISSRLKSTWGGADSWDLWRSEATPVLPAGVFVWLDEFREWYGRTRPGKVKKAHLLLAHPEGDEQHDNVLKEVLKSMERPWDTAGDDLSLVQSISESDYCMAMEGFPLACVQSAPTTPEQPVSAVADREELARLITEAEARRKEEELKAAEVARLATERAEIARQEATEAEAQRIEQAQHQGNVGPAQTIGPALPTARTHRLKSRVHALDAVIELAKQEAINPTDYQSTWAALVKMAESKCPPPVCGYSSDGIKYKGKGYEKTGVPDMFTKDALRMKMKRSAR